jgi:hypothetical protein
MDTAPRATGERTLNVERSGGGGGAKTNARVSRNADADAQSGVDLKPRSVFERGPYLFVIETRSVPPDGEEKSKK